MSNKNLHHSEYLVLNLTMHLILNPFFTTQINIDMYNHYFKIILIDAKIYTKQAYTYTLSFRYIFFAYRLLIPFITEILIYHIEVFQAF